MHLYPAPVRFGLAGAAHGARPVAMRQYLDLMDRVLTQGVRQMDRTGTGTLSVFGHQMRFDLAKGFPVLTTKKLHLRSIIVELLWFLRGDTNVRWLQDRRVSIWDEWADETGDLGPVYGKQWRDWATADGRHIDQIAELVEQIRTQPASRRQIVSAWNPGDLHAMALAPCHCLFQTHVADGRLSLQLYQRSADIFLGVPFNIASYALLTHMLAQQCDLEVGEFIWTGGDCHLYLNHLEQAQTQWGASPARCRVWKSCVVRRRSMPMSRRISCCTTMWRSRISRRRSRYDRPDPGAGAQRRDRARRRAALAPARRSQAVQGADHGAADDHGPQDLRQLSRAAARATAYRADARPRMAGGGRGSRARRGGALALAGRAMSSSSAARRSSTCSAIGPIVSN